MSTQVDVSEVQSAVILDPFGTAEIEDGAMFFHLEHGDLAAIHFAATSYSRAKSIVQLTNRENEREVVRLASFDGADSFGDALALAERIAEALGLPVVPHDQVGLLVDHFFTQRVSEAC